jgi:hypothetical protein
VLQGAAPRSARLQHGRQALLPTGCTRAAAAGRRVGAEEPSSMAPISTELAAEPSRAETQKLSAARHDVIDAEAHAWLGGWPARHRVATRDSRGASRQRRRVRRTRCFPHINQGQTQQRSIGRLHYLQAWAVQRRWGRWFGAYGGQMPAPDCGGTAAVPASQPVRPRRAGQLFPERVDCTALAPCLARGPALCSQLLAQDQPPGRPAGCETLTYPAACSL